MITTVLAFLVTLAVLIVVHEYGHYRTAVACGVKVLRFSVGFGRVIWRRQRGETEFVLSALPLGGYVRMLDEREAPVAPNELHRAFNRKPLWQRAAIVFAGPAANLVLAIVLHAASHWIGIEEAKPVLGTPIKASMAETAGLRATDWVQAWRDESGQWQDMRSMSDLRWQVTQHALRGQTLTLRVSDAQGRGMREVQLPLQQVRSDEVDATLLKRIGLGGPYSEPLMGEIKPASPAERAGLKSGDRVLGVDDQPIAEAQALRERIRNSVVDGVARPMRWSVERGSQVLTIVVEPRVAPDGDRRVGRIDAFVGAPPAMVTVRHGPIEGLVKGAERTWDVSVMSLKMLGRMLIGEVSIKNLSGPLTIADYAASRCSKGCRTTWVSSRW